MSFKQWLNEHYEERGPMQWLAFFLELISSLVLFSLMVMTCIDVLGRYLFNSPVRGGTELTEFALAIIVFSILPVVTWRGGQIVVDLIDIWLPQKVLTVLAWVAAICMSGSLYFLAWRIFELGERNLKRGILTEFLSMPTGYLMIYIAVFSWLTAAGLLVYKILSLRARSKITMDKGGLP